MPHNLTARLHGVWSRFPSGLAGRGVCRPLVEGRGNIPVEGPVLLVANHVTPLDALLVASASRRIDYFLVSRELSENWWPAFARRKVSISLISPEDSPGAIRETLSLVDRLLCDGKAVCIFPEGMMTKTGHVRRFIPEVERWMAGLRCPLIPVHIGNPAGAVGKSLRGTCLARVTGGRSGMTVVFGNPVEKGGGEAVVRQALQELSKRSFDMRKRKGRCLGWAVMRSARCRWKHEAVVDSTGAVLTYGRLVTAALLVARKLRSRCRGAANVGILVPASAGAAVANVAVSLLGKVAVNLNFTGTLATVESAVRQSGIRTILTSRRFLEKLGMFGDLPGIVCLEDLKADAGLLDKVWAYLKARLWPLRFLVADSACDPDEVAAIVFSSGSTAEPKGVKLTHHNLLSNIEGFVEVLRFGTEDRMCGILPFFHSFGLTCTLWCPLLVGIPVVYHSNPLDIRKVLHLVKTHGLTILLATPTFLLGYIRKGEPQDFASLRLVVTGAEKLQKRIADAFEEKFGVRPLEGYGATELAPVVAVNVMPAGEGAALQVGMKEGSIGLPIPGVAVRVVGPERGEVLNGGAEGLLHVYGPNVMAGYLKKPEETAEVVRDGWYDTGDIARIDNDGFIFITDRVSRFSKIGGEMVPHVAVEDDITDRLGILERVIAVTSVEDAARGEKLVVLYDRQCVSPEQLAQAIRRSRLPNLWRPRTEDCYPVDAIPTLGSGKLDLSRVRRIAQDILCEKEDADSRSLRER